MQFFTVTINDIPYCRGATLTEALTLLLTALREFGARVTLEPEPSRTHSFQGGK